DFQPAVHLAANVEALDDELTVFFLAPEADFSAGVGSAFGDDFIGACGQVLGDVELEGFLGDRERGDERGAEEKRGELQQRGNSKCRHERHLSRMESSSGKEPLFLFGQAAEETAGWAEEGAIVVDGELG